ncbi:MAG: hypothetical protein ACYSTT_20490, partial [Planctomycetota bacterium]
YRLPKVFIRSFTAARRADTSSAGAIDLPTAGLIDKTRVRKNIDKTNEQKLRILAGIFTSQHPNTHTGHPNLQHNIKNSREINVSC